MCADLYGSVQVANGSVQMPNISVLIANGLVQIVHQSVQMDTKSTKYYKQKSPQDTCPALFALLPPLTDEECASTLEAERIGGISRSGVGCGWYLKLAIMILLCCQNYQLSPTPPRNEIEQSDVWKL